MKAKVILMATLIFKAYWKLVVFDLYMTLGGFAKLHQKVRNCPVSRRGPSSNTMDRIFSAMDMACIWYWKKVLCLQRSAATVCLLKEYGLPAQMAIGVQQIPFRAHAWVEFEGRVVNERASTPETYAVLERC